MFSNGRRSPQVVVGIQLAIVFIIAVQVVRAIYLPVFPNPSNLVSTDSLSRRQDDSDEQDDMDSTASAPGYQNQEDSPQRDGYEDADADGNYEETPRDQEGQADLERFFDDHLGASDRDGMDKENLPTNLAPIVVENPLVNAESRLVTSSIGGLRPSANTRQLRNFINTPIYSYLDKKFERLPNKDQSGSGSGGSEAETTTISPLPAEVETQITRLPDDKMLITQRSTTKVVDPGRGINGGSPTLIQDTTQLSMIDEFKAHPADLVPGLKDKRGPMETLESGVVAMENDDMDKIYVTHSTDKPFKIDHLGGYDPEEDFENASRDIEGTDDIPRGKSSRRNSDSARARRSDGEQANNGEDPGSLKDISFNDSDTEDLFNDASENEDIIFAHDDPDQLDSDEPEPARRPRSTTQHGEPEAKASEIFEEEPEEEHGAPEEDMGEAGMIKPRMDDDETSWVNDGVDDMEVPSETEQEEVIERTARKGAKLRREKERQRRAEEDAAARAKAKDDDESYSENQRMPNANYLNEDDDLD